MTKRQEKRKIKEWIPEISFGILLLLGMIFISLPAVTKWAWLEDFKQIIGSTENIINWLTKPTNLIAIILILATTIFFFKRLGYHVYRLNAFDETCPVCHHRIRKLRRKWYHRLLSAFMPVRRYYCPHCGWKGARINKKKSMIRDKK